MNGNDFPVPYQPDNEVVQRPPRPTFQGCPVPCEPRKTQRSFPGRDIGTIYLSLWLQYIHLTYIYLVTLA